MREDIRRAMVVQTSRIRFLEAWARKLSTQNPEAIGHAVQVFAQTRFQVSKCTARKYARKVVELLELNFNDSGEHFADTLPKYLGGERNE